MAKRVCRTSPTSLGLGVLERHLTRQQVDGAPLVVVWLGCECVSKRAYHAALHSCPQNMRWASARQCFPRLSEPGNLLMAEDPGEK